MAKFNRSEKFGVDIKETWLYEYPAVYDGADEHLKGKHLLEVLLYDHTTEKNIKWGTEDYGFPADSEILPEQICSSEDDVLTEFRNKRIRPRVAKEKEEQERRTRDKAEVFTPSWVCNKQNNLVDNAWFGRENVFNVELDEGNSHNWITKPVVDILPTEVGKYINDYRLEMTCGEAPYLVSRYDTVTGSIIPIVDRIGLLDRKLRVASQMFDDGNNWGKAVKKSYMATYGFEWQGDNLLLARENMLASFIEYYRKKWDAEPLSTMVMLIAEIISWNVWQMDGLTGCVPYTNIPARIKDWGKLHSENSFIIEFNELSKK